MLYKDLKFGVYAAKVQYVFIYIASFILYPSTVRIALEKTNHAGPVCQYKCLDYKLKHAQHNGP